MADINVNIKGDSSGAQQAMQQMATSTDGASLALKDIVEGLSRMEKIMREGGAATKSSAEETAKATVKWQEYVNAAKKAAEAVIEFAKDSVKEYAKAEQVQAQLVRVAGQYADVLGAQADALSKKNNVEDDTIKQAETLLAQWGGVAAASKETTQAVLDYAAAMGVDVVTATQDVIRNVESGGKGLAKMGVQIQATGDRGKDLALVVDALGQKFGGASEANADTLAGRAAGLDVAMGNLKETFGEFFADLDSNLSITKTFTEAINWMADSLGNLSARADREYAAKVKHLSQAESDLRIAKEQYDDAVTRGEHGAILDAFRDDVAAAKELLKQARAQLGIFSKGDAPKVTGLTNQGTKDAEQAAKDAARAREDREKAAEDEREKYFAIQQEQKAGEQRLAEEQSRAEEYSINLSKEQTKALEEELKKRGEVEKKAADDAASARKKALDKEAADLKHQQQAWSSAAEQIGAAFVSSLTEQLNKLASGGEFDAALFVGEILAATISVAGSVIGSALGQPALGSAIGNLAAMGVRAGAGAISAENHKKAGTSLPKYHDGGWVGGAQEQVALLREKERVLTPEEVTRMGGPASVDALAMGGGRSLSAGSRTINLNVSAVDAKSVKELFSGDGSRGMREAVRTGQGALPKLLRVNPR